MREVGYLYLALPENNLLAAQRAGEGVSPPRSPGDDSLVGNIIGSQQVSDFTVLLNLLGSPSEIFS